MMHTIRVLITCKIRRFHREVRPYTKQHLFELGCTLVHILLSTVNFIYLVVVESGDIPEFKYMMTLGWSIIWFLRYSSVYVVY